MPVADLQSCLFPSAAPSRPFLPVYLRLRLPGLGLAWGALAQNAAACLISVAYRHVSLACVVATEAWPRLPFGQAPSELSHVTRNVAAMLELT